MAKSSGKVFEDDFKESCEKQDVCFTRLYDTMHGFANVANPCDYILYQYPTIFYLELKSTVTGTLPLSNISKNQYDSLKELDKHEGVVAGFLIKYTKFEEHYFVPISEIKRLKKMNIKSVKYKDIQKGKIGCVKMPSRKKVTHYDYDVEVLLYGLEEEYGLST